MSKRNSILKVQLIKRCDFIHNFNEKMKHFISILQYVCFVCLKLNESDQKETCQYTAITFLKCI